MSEDEASERSPKKAPNTPRSPPAPSPSQAQSQAHAQGPAATTPARSQSQTPSQSRKRYAAGSAYYRLDEEPELHHTMPYSRETLYSMNKIEIINLYNDALVNL